MHNQVVPYTTGQDFISDRTTLDILHLLLCHKVIRASQTPLQIWDLDHQSVTRALFQKGNWRKQKD